MAGMKECPACGSVGGDPSHIGPVRFGSFAYSYLACRACDSLFADPMPGQEVLARIYDPTYTATHYSAELDGESSSEELLRESHQALSLLSGSKRAGRLLDVGCGAGKFLVLAQHSGFRVEGHELLPASADVAQRATGIPVHGGPLSSLSPTYDIVHMADVLEHSPRPLDLLREALALLAPEGVLLLRGPLENQANLFLQMMKLRRRVSGMLRTPAPSEMPPHHVNLFTISGWRNLLRRAALIPIFERVYEIHWPAPERFTPTIVSVAKTMSLAMSATPLGRRRALGNRVVSLLRRQAEDGTARVG